MIGKSILHYKILEKLGEGGMGVVYLAEDIKLERKVAIKFLPRHIAASEEERQRFEIEAKAAAVLNHPNIATIHAIEEHDDEIFIVMEYIEGEELKDRLNREPMAIDEVIATSIQIAEGLQAAHEKGIVHRDIKSSNIMLTKKGQVKIMDFGLAKVRGNPELTKAGSTLGTTAYMSPEQIRGEKVDQRSDIWSFGVALYGMITGEMPFKADYDQAMMYAILNEEPPALVEQPVEVTPSLEAIAMKCLQKNVVDRYQSTDELLEDLHQLKNQSRVDKSTINAAKGKTLKNRKTWIVSAIVIAFALLALFTGYFFFKDETKPAGRVPIAVVDFINHTNEPELNGLSGMLITALEQSRHLVVMSRARMYDEFKQMNRTDLTFVDEAAGREIAKRANIAALAVATIRNFDNLYSIDFKVIDPQTGDRLFSTKVEAEGKKSIPGLLDQLAEKTRIDLKEEQKALQLASRGVAEVTTTNLEAYQHYFQGEQLMSRMEIQAAREEYKKAIELDSTFGLACYRLANAYTWGFAEEFAKEPVEKAFEFIDRIPEKERYLLRAVAAHVEKGYAAAIPVAKEMERYYPYDKEMLYFIADWSFHANLHQQAIEYFEKVLAIDPTHEKTLYHLATAYYRTNRHDRVQSAIERLAQVNPAAAFEVQGNYSASQGEYEKAIEYYNKALKADSTWANAPTNMKSYTYQRMGQFKNALEAAQQYLAQNPVAYAYYRVARCYLFLGDIETAKRTIESGLPHFPDSRLQVNLGEVSAWRGEYDLAEAQLRATVSPDQPDRVRSLGLERLATFYLYQGKYSAMTRMFDERIKMALADQDNISAAEIIAKKAYWMYLGWRDKNRVYKELESAAQLSDVFNEEYFTWLAGTYAFMGDFKQAEKAYRQIVYQIRKLIIESHILLQKKEWGQAIDINNLLINKWDASGQTLYRYLNAICYYEQGELDKAIEEITKAANFYSWDHSYVYPQSFLLLSKIYEKKGDKQRAVENTEKFLNLWKDADPDLPDLIDAKERLARLKEE